MLPIFMQFSPIHDSLCLVKISIKVSDLAVIDDKVLLQIDS